MIFKKGQIVEVARNLSARGLPTNLPNAIHVRKGCKAIVTFDIPEGTTPDTIVGVNFASERIPMQIEFIIDTNSISGIALRHLREVGT